MANPVIKLHLGCGRTRMDDWVNCDLHKGPNVDHTFDVQQRWPFPDNTVSAIYASHMLEHLSNPLAFFREAHRVLLPNASMMLRLPYGGHALAWVDLTHQRPWFAETFCMLQPGYGDSVGNPQHDEWQHPFGVSASLRISGKWARLMRWWPIRRFLLGWGDNIQNFIEELWVTAYALKTPEAVETYRKAHAPNAIVSEWTMYRHQYEGKDRVEPGSKAELVVFGSDYHFIGFFNQVR